jgi:hypothetical protein
MSVVVWWRWYKASHASMVFSMTRNQKAQVVTAHAVLWNPIGWEPRAGPEKANGFENCRPLLHSFFQHTSFALDFLLVSSSYLIFQR